MTVVENNSDHWDFTRHPLEKTNEEVIEKRKE